MCTSAIIIARAPEYQQRQSISWTCHDAFACLMRWSIDIHIYVYIYIYIYIYYIYIYRCIVPSEALPQLLQQPSQITSHPSRIATTNICMHHTKQSYFFTRPGVYAALVMCCSQLGNHEHECCIQGSKHASIYVMQRAGSSILPIKGGAAALKLLWTRLSCIHLLPCHATLNYLLIFTAFL